MEHEYYQYFTTHYRTRMLIGVIRSSDANEQCVQSTESLGIMLIIHVGRPKSISRNLS